MAERRKDYQDTTGVGIGSVPNAAALNGVTVVEIGNEAFHQSVFTFKNTVVSIADTGGVNGGFGSLQIYEGTALGNVSPLANSINISLVTAAGIANAINQAVGTAAAAVDGALTATEADIVASAALTVTASAAARNTAAIPTPAMFTTGTDLHLNFGVLDANISASSSVTVNGTLKVTWVKA